MPEDQKSAAEDTDLVNEPAENTAADEALIDEEHDNGTPNDDDAESGDETGLEETEDGLEEESEQLEEKAKSFFHDNPLVVALHNLLAGHKVKNSDGSYTINVPDEHVGAAHDALADATKT